MDCGHRNQHTSGLLTRRQNRYGLVWAEQLKNAGAQIRDKNNLPSRILKALRGATTHASERTVVIGFLAGKDDDPCRAAELSNFHRSLRILDYTRKRMEKLYQDGKITKRDLDSVYEALFLRAVTSFEAFLEELFLGILERRIRYKPGRVSLRMTIKSRAALMDILLQGGKYLTWLPFQNTEERAKLYLIDGKPFTDLTDGDKSVIQDDYDNSTCNRSSKSACDE